MLCSPRSLRPGCRRQWLDALLTLSFSCVALYWISQSTVDAAAAPAGGSSVTVADGFKALLSWGRQLTCGLLRIRLWPASASGKQGRGSHSSAQHSTRPGFSSMTLRARWSRTLAGVFAVARPLLQRITQYLEPVASMRLRLLLPTLSYAGAVTALALGCSIHLSSARQQACALDFEQRNSIAIPPLPPAMPRQKRL